LPQCTFLFRDKHSFRFCTALDEFIVENAVEFVSLEQIPSSLAVAYTILFVRRESRKLISAHRVCLSLKRKVVICLTPADHGKAGRLKKTK